MARKTSTLPNFVIEFQLLTEKFQEDELDRRFEILRKIYNSVTSTFLKRYQQMIKTKEWRDINNKLFNTEDKKEINTKIKNRVKEVNNKGLLLTDEIYLSLLKELEELKTLTLTPTEITNLKQRKSDIIRNNGFVRDGIYGKSGTGVGWKQYDHFSSIKSNGITANVVTFLCKSIETAFEQLVFKKGEMVKFKKRGELNSVKSRTLQGGSMDAIKWSLDDSGVGSIKWGNLTMKSNFDKNNQYESEALTNKIVTSQIVRKKIRGKYKYYIQLCLEGYLPNKINKTTGKYKRYIGQGNVGLDIGTQTLAVTSDTKVKLVELAKNVNYQEKEIKKQQRKLDRSRRINNPDCFKEDGQWIKGKKVKVNSNNYLKTKNSIAELQRKQAAIRKQDHINLANELLSLGDNFKVEKMSFKGLTHRAKETTTNKNGKINKKKRFGKSIGKKAPAMFLGILKNKIEGFGGQYNEVNTSLLKASQYHHDSDEFKKKPLSKRKINLDNGNEYQRDLYSSFLLQNVNDDLSTYDKEMLLTKEDNFKKLHDMEYNRVLIDKPLSSMKK